MYNLIDILILSKLVKSRADAKRLIVQGQVMVNGKFHNGNNIFDPIEINEDTRIICRNQVVTFEEL